MKRMAVLVAVLGLLVAGCARDEEPETQEPSPEPTEAQVNDHGTETFTTEEFQLELELDDFYFEPTFIKSPGAATATLDLFNEGSATHTFTADGLGVDEELAPGDRRTVTVEIGTETRYEFYCRFHEAQGMRGAFMPH